MLAAGTVSLSDGLTRFFLLTTVEVPLLILILRLSVQPEASLEVGGSRKRLALVMIILALLLGWQLHAARSMIGIWILTGSLVVLAGTWIQQSEISLHKHFNHNDLCHIFFMIGMYFLFRGGLLFRDA